MSSDKRPAKVRVFSSQGRGIPERRRDDIPPEAEAEAAAAPPVPAAETPPESRDRVALLAGLFVVGAAIGGAGLALLGLVQGGQ